MSDAGRQNARYRELASRYVLNLMTQGSDRTDFRVSQYGGVHPTPDGAFVEVEVWIPKQALTTEDSNA